MPPRIPAGARDILAVEAEELREVADRWRAHVALAGYREVATPMLEYAEAVDRAQAGASDDAYRLFDEAGRVMVLRPDLTIPVARLVATRLADHPGPVRVSYVASAFRPPRPGRPRATELRQAGIEMVGAAHPGADAEVIAVLVGSLRAAGVRRPRIALGDVSLTRAVMDGLGVDTATRTALGRALSERDLVGWRERVGAAGLAQEGAALLADLPTLSGDVTVLDRIRETVPSAREACESLERTVATAARHGVDRELRVDLGVLRDWSYYSGVVFEAYAPGASEPLAVGGRYDGLAERFGAPRPAIGFAVALEQLHRAVLEVRGSYPALRAGVVLVGGLDTHAEPAADARAAGVTVIALGADDGDRADALAAAEGWRYVARPEYGGTLAVSDRAWGEKRICADLREFTE
ncbi:MAG: ATP phosphoribosyltransferase regulatory subunit [Acidimicrobiales bacterium]